MKKLIIAAVEDDFISLKLLKKHLEALGHEIVSFTDGTEIIEAFQQHQVFDLVVTDFMMPVKNGREVVEFMRSRDDLKNIPVVLQSAVVNEMDVEHLLGPLVQFVEKPLSKKNLEKAISKLIDPGNTS